MPLQLSQELAAALRACQSGALEVVDPDTARVYFIVDGATHRQALEALRRQRDLDAIAQGLAEIEAGLGVPLDEARQLTREHLRARKQ